MEVTASHSMSMDMPRMWFQYYERMEPWIRIARQMSYNMAFEGGVEVSWGKRFKESKRGNTERQNQLKELLKNAVDYRRVLGCCPFMVLNDPVTNEKTAIIPPIGSIKFVLRANPVTLQSELSFVPDLDVLTSYQNSSIGPMNALPLTSVNGDKAFGLNYGANVQNFVFVWPQYRPDTFFKEFKSDMAPLFKMFLELEEKRAYDLQSAFVSAYPTVFLRREPSKVGEEGLTEKEYYGDDDGGRGPLEGATYMRSVKKSKELEAAAREAMKKSANRKEAPQVSRDTGRIENIRRRFVWENNLYHLPDGLNVVGGPQTRSDAGLLAERQHYEETVCTTMGVPRTILSQQGRVLTAAVQEEQSTLENTVKTIRDDARDFYQFVYNAMYKKEEDILIERALRQVNEVRENLKRQLEAQVSIEENQKTVEDGKILPDVSDLVSSVKDHETKIRDAANEGQLETLRQLDAFYEEAGRRLQRRALKNDRIQLSFPKNPFARSVDPAKLASAAQRGALSSVEELNLMREPFGLPPLSESDPLVARNETIRKLEIENMKPVPPANGGPARPKKKQKTESSSK